MLSSKYSTIQQPMYILQKQPPPLVSSLLLPLKKLSPVKTIRGKSILSSTTTTLILFSSSSIPNKKIKCDCESSHPGNQNVYSYYYYCGHGFSTLPHIHVSFTMQNADTAPIKSILRTINHSSAFQSHAKISSLVGFPPLLLYFSTSHL